MPVTVAKNVLSRGNHDIKEKKMQSLYAKIKTYSTHPQAFWILMLMSFLESFIFPIPPDILMALMIVAKRDSALKLAFWATVFSCLGGIVGYSIGYFLYQTVGVFIIETYGYQQAALGFQEIAKSWGFWVIALKSLTPIPFKVVTILAGAASMDFQAFIFACFIGRGTRFFIFAMLCWYFGPQLDDIFKRRMGLVLIIMLGIIVFGFWLIKVIL